MPFLNRRHVLAGAVALVPAPPALAAPPGVEVWKSRACGCCSAWASHLERAGFVVQVHEVDDIAAVRAAAGVPADLGGCHTSKVAGYVIEGHVPATAVRRLLAERPPILGISAPGMPLGSPGMEIEGEPAQPFEVIAFSADGGRSLFERIRP